MSDEVLYRVFGLDWEFFEFYDREEPPRLDEITSIDDAILNKVRPRSRDHSVIERYYDTLNI